MEFFLEVLTPILLLSMLYTGQLHQGASQGTGIDYIPALYESTSFNIV